MPWKETSVMEQKIRLVIRAVEGGECVSSLCREFGISRPTAYRWISRYKDVGSIESLLEHSRRPLSSPLKTAPEIEKRVVELRRHYGWGGRKLAVLLGREGIELSVPTVNRIIKRNGLLPRRDCQGIAVKRFEREAPNELWQVDFKGPLSLAEGPCHPLSIIDDHSRFAVGLFPLATQRTQPVTACFTKAFERYGLPDGILMDHGTPWWSTAGGSGLTRLSVFLIKQGIRLHHGRYCHPQTQGKVERFHRTLGQYLHHWGRPESFRQMSACLSSFRKEYNEVRPHEALLMAAPREQYRPSEKRYNAHPPEWEYPQGTLIRRLNSLGAMRLSGRSYFISLALAGERVAIEYLAETMLVKYRHMYVREIEIKSGRSSSLVLPD